MLKVECMFIHIKSDESLPMAKKIIMNGGVIVFPTDTVYGVGCLPSDEKAVIRVAAMKGRGEKPLPILCFDAETSFKLIKWNPMIDRLAELFWPGPLTIVGKVKDNVKLPAKITYGTGKLGVRVQSLDWTLALLKEVGGSLVGTSANRSGYGSPVTLAQTLTRLGRDADLYVDGGETIYGGDSTVVDVSEGKIVVLREGALPVKDLFP
jgi:L-threonylcarbamoyladenylate synthase